jgi:formate hydrogenlyase subunit 4
MRRSFSRSPSSILATGIPGPALDHLGDLLGAHGLFDHDAVVLACSSASASCFSSCGITP